MMRMNNLTRSSAFDIKLSQLSHVTKLKKIITSPSTLSEFTNYKRKPTHNKKSAEQVSKHNHEKARSFRNLELKRSLVDSNKKMVRSLVRITTRNSDYPHFESYRRKAGNSFTNEKKMKEEIRRENPEIAKRITRQKPSLSHMKSQKQFIESRERIERISQFDFMKKLSQRSLMNISTKFALRKPSPRKAVKSETSQKPYKDSKMMILFKQQRISDIQIATSSQNNPRQNMTMGDISHSESKN